MSLRVRLLEGMRRTHYWVGPRFYGLHDGVARLFRRGTHIIECIDGADPCRSSDKAAVFCHHDPRGVVHDYVLHYLQSLCAANFRIHFVSNVPKLPESAVERLQPCCARIIYRTNAGRDFGAYKDGILSIRQRTELSSLLIANDSVYGPFEPLTALLARMDPETADVWGLTDSYEYRYHLQSYFVIFHRTALRHPAFERYWGQLAPSNARGWVIHFGEVGLTQTLARSGLRVRAAFPYEGIVDRFRSLMRDRNTLRREDLPVRHRNYLESVSGAIDVGIPLNATHFFWDQLIGDMGFPFIKRDLLEWNPAHVPAVGQWRELIKRCSTYDVELIACHQKLRLRNRSV